MRDFVATLAALRHINHLRYTRAIEAHHGDSFASPASRQPDERLRNPIYPSLANQVAVRLFSPLSREYRR